MDIVRLNQYGSWHIKKGENTLCNIDTSNACRDMSLSEKAWKTIDLKCIKCDSIHFEYAQKKDDINALQELTKEIIHIDSDLDKKYLRKLQRKHKANKDPKRFLEGMNETENKDGRIYPFDPKKGFGYEFDPSVYA
jgi:hypothetical protein